MSDDAPVRYALDPELARIFDLMPLVDLGNPAATRTMLAQGAAATRANGTRATDERVTEDDRTIEGPGGPIPIRVYAPVASTATKGALVYFHGGAFVLGDLELEHGRCVRLAAEADVVVVSVDYRLAPEHPFPAGFDDCVAALAWTVANAEDLNVDPARIAVGGSSAGGALAAAVALHARDNGGPHLAFQMLIYPVIDSRLETASTLAFETTPGWTSIASTRMWANYLSDQRDATSPYASPAHAESLVGLPPAYVMTAEFDPLRDEGIAYAARLLADGVSTDLCQIAGTAHGFDLISPTAEISVHSVTEQVRATARAISR
jgi:acetyl esterase